MSQFREEINTERLRSWLSNGEPLDDVHVDTFLKVREWKSLPRPGPIRVLPKVVERSIVLYEAALDFVDRPRRTVDLIIELRDGRKPLSQLPRSVGEINRLLSVTPPWLWIRDDNAHPELNPQVRLSVRDLDTAGLFGKWMSQANVERVKAELKEYTSPDRLARYITLSLIDPT